MSQTDREDIYFDSQFNSLEYALQSTTHLAVGAHQDDLEVMASHGILECYQSTEKNFVGVTCTDGGGSARTGQYANFSDNQMSQLRKEEQIKSARLGKFAAMLQLGFASSTIKSGWNKELIDRLKDIINQSEPDVIYTHNLADKHFTHVAVALHLIEALRELSYRPQQFFGCEVWRGLDWLSDESKCPLPISNPQLMKDLIACHQSQTEGGKRYDEASLGRLKANATYFKSHQVDQESDLWFAMDLNDLLRDKTLSYSEFIEAHLKKFQAEVMSPFKNFSEKRLFSGSDNS